MPGGVPERGKVPPYFFFSYHRSAYRARDPDRWSRKLFEDLCVNVHNLTGTSNPGFRDVEIPLATEWPMELAEALACCRVFVPVLWPPYFTSPFCGKEWAAFTRRARMHAGAVGVHAAMVPLLWSPFRLDELPPQVTDVNLIPPGLSQKYQEEGIFGLMRLKRHLATYQDSLWLLAKMIKEAAEATNLPASAPMDLKAIPSAFTEHLAAQVTHQVRVIVAARPVGPERSAYYYGRTMLEWTPYRDDDPLPLAQHAEQTIAVLGYHAVIEAINSATGGIGAHGLSMEAQQQRPVVLLLDPWAAGVPWIRKKLQAIDADQVHVVVPWNDADEETAEHAARLREDIRAAIPASLALSGSAPRVPTLEAFRSLLPKAVNEAITMYFRTAPAYPPEEPTSMDKPTLGGPGA